MKKNSKLTTKAMKANKGIFRIGLFSPSPLCAFCVFAVEKMVIFLLVLLFLAPVFISAQDEFGGFGFGDSADLSDEFSGGFSGGSSSQKFSISIGGEASAGLTIFYNDLSSSEKIKNFKAGDIFSGKLNFEAAGSAAQAVINLNLSPVFDGSSSPVEIDEAYLRAFFGPVNIEGGLRKLSWGKADSFGPLDVINPLDYTDLTKISDPKSIKIPRPMIHAAWSMGSFTKLEAVFVPWFQGHKFATETSNRWMPGQMSDLAPVLVAGLKTAMTDISPGLSAYFPDLDTWQKNFNIENYYWDRNVTLKYAQAGLRFTTSIGSSDFGFQYYFGRLPRPSVSIGIDEYIGGLISGSPDTSKIAINVAYNYYHQIGFDFARVLAGFNLRAEAGANLTKDLDGTDGTVENPALVWSLGFDRDLFWSINLNLQGTGRIRLFHDKIGSNALSDCEAGTNMSSTRITGIFSRKFLRDEIELKLTGLWGIEDKDFLVMPAFIWTCNSVSAEVSAGFFGGDKKGELGQYRDNGFAKLVLSYKF